MVEMILDSFGQIALTAWAASHFVLPEPIRVQFEQLNGLATRRTCY